jgi:hypothetical protein
MATPHEKIQARAEIPLSEVKPALTPPGSSSEAVANRSLWIGFLVWVAGFSFLMLLLVFDLIAGLFFRR